MTPPFNLASDNWIPCINLDGSFQEYSLQSVFERATTIREIHPELPLMTPQLTRLLLAIAHRAWRGESVSARGKEWHAWWNARRFPDQLFAYLDEQRSNFELFDADKPFYQTSHLKILSAKESDKSVLQLVLNQGNNPTLFDHNTEVARRRPYLPLLRRGRYWWGKPI